MRQLLITALARHAGQPLTPEVAKAIVREACVDEDRSILPSQFGEKKFGEYVLRAERIAGNEAELAPLHKAYHDDVKFTDDALAYSFAELREAERNGTRVMFTARTYDGRLIGVLRIKVFRVFETQKLAVSDDMLYCMPDAPAVLPMTMFKWAEERMFQYGVREVSFSSLNVHGADRLAFALGYTAVGTIFTKSAQEASTYGDVRRRRPAKARHASLPQL